MAFPQASDYRPPIIPDGELYDNPENGKSYHWTQILLPEGSTPDTATSIGGYWTVVCDPGDPIFVLKTGDTMTGALVMDTADIDLHNGDITFEPQMPAADLADPDNRFSLIKSASPIDTDTDLVDHTTSFGVRVDIDDGNTFKNRFQVGNRHGNIVQITGGSGPQIEFATTGFTPNSANTGLTSGIAIRHIPTPNFEESPGDLAVNKQYVDQRDVILAQGIIELEEEIDAIAPSVERGQFIATADNNAPQDGEFMLATAAGKTLDYGDPNITTIQISKIDNSGVSHTYADVEAGQLLQLLEAGNPDYGLYLIDGIDGNNDPVKTVVTFTVSSISGFGEATDGDLARLKIFSPPSGGTASEFVLKTGDTMTGDLTIDRSEGGPTDGGSAGKEAALTLKGDRTGTTNAVATIMWDNAASSYPGYLTYRSGDGSEQFFKFNQDVQFNDKNLSLIDSISIKNNLTKGDSNRITFQSGSGDAGKGTIIIHRPGNLQRGFTIKGKIAGSSNTAGDVFYHYANSGGGGDSVDYTGICTSANHIMNRSQADGRYVQTGTTGIKITKSNGNYYIQG